MQHYGVNVPCDSIPIEGTELNATHSNAEPGNKKMRTEGTPATTKLARGRKKSPARDVFDVRGDKLVCRICCKQYNVTTSSTTLKNHVNDHMTRTDTFDKSLADRYLAQCILVNNISPTFLECPYTKRWIRYLRGNYISPGRTYFSTTLVSNEVATVRATMKTKLQRIPSFCISFDGWSSLSVRGYLGLLVHGIDDNWALQSYFLALKRIGQSEKAEYVASLVKEVMKIAYAFSCITDDGRKK